ncbi:MAG: hypothetical protein SH868_01050 [Bythopirellula sp.]|nr:hypothetical protein [Bythopirellula sp.]
MHSTEPLSRRHTHLELTGQLLNSRHKVNVGNAPRYINQTQFDALLLLTEAALLESGEGVSLEYLFSDRDDLNVSRKYIQRLRQELGNPELIVSSAKRRYRLNVEAHNVVIRQPFWQLGPSSVPVQLRDRLQRAYANSAAVYPEVDSAQLCFCLFVVTPLSSTTQFGVDTLPITPQQLPSSTDQIVPLPPTAISADNSNSALASCIIACPS